ncbi:hypothetical protein AA309_17510 [Microvirga vignae]|uniref:Uncharacterized protein n=1 Tax=Microvirga vignae TaxID=1225564 RepID=A0A0H1RA23_9HYPH|nr:hypothetical protein AA309_17510 [Microvirga vignae]
MEHEGYLREQGRGEPARRSLSTGRAQTRPGRPLTLARAESGSSRASLGKAIGKSVAGAHPCDRPTRGEIEDVGIAGETVHDGVRGDAGSLKAPAAGQPEGFGVAGDEGDEELWVGAAWIAKPEPSWAVLRRHRELKGLGRRVFAAVLGHQRRVDVEDLRGIGGRAKVEQAGVAVKKSVMSGS